MAFHTVCVVAIGARGKRERTVAWREVRAQGSPCHLHRGQQRRSTLEQGPPLLCTHPAPRHSHPHWCRQVTTTPCFAEALVHCFGGLAVLRSCPDVLQSSVDVGTAGQLQVCAAAAVAA